MSNYKIEDQYPLSIFKEAHIPYSWDTIYVGRELKLLTGKEIEKYVTEYLMLHPECNNQYVIELATETEDSMIKPLLIKVFEYLGLPIIEKDSKRWNIEWIKWRYCILKFMQRNIKNINELLEAISFIYADFGYPEDMGSFIYYMPAEGINDNKEQLLTKLNHFLEQEKHRIESKTIDALPSRIIN